MRKITSFFVLVAFIFSCITPPQGFAQAGVFVPAAPQVVQSSEVFTPALLRGFRIAPDSPLTFDFIVDKGDASLDGQLLQDEGRKLIKYFLTALTVPSKELWVNLSPYENDRIIPEQFGRTEMGRDLLAQDYILKQLTASLMYPETDLGKVFWQRVYERAYTLFGTTEIPIDTFNKVWIMPDKAGVYEKGGSVYLVDARMKVLLEQDHVALENNRVEASAADDKYSVSKFASDIVRDVIVPEIAREVNEGKAFAQLRQVHYSLILAAWYEKKIKDGILGQMFVGQNKIAGQESDDPKAKEKIYARYVEAFKTGVYNYIKDEEDIYSREVIPRKYFSGGYTRGEISFDNAALPEKAPRTVAIRADLTPDRSQKTGDGYIQEVRNEAKEGDEVVLRAVLNDPEAAKKYKVILHSNKDKDGVWRDGEELKYIGDEDGKSIFEIRVKAERSFSYTFAFEAPDEERTWAELPHGNGQVLVWREFKGSVVYIGMEFGPFVKKGGQGDVMYELPRAMAKQGNDVTVILPYFKNRAAAFAKNHVVEDLEGIEIVIPFENRPAEKLKVKKAVVDGITVYLLDAESKELFHEPYTGKMEQFYESILLSQGSLELLKMLGKKVDVIQSNDHHTGLVDLYMQKKYQETFKNSASYFAIHNVAYQGEYGDMLLLKGDAAKGRPDQFLTKAEFIKKIRSYELYHDGFEAFNPQLFDEIRRMDEWAVESSSNFNWFMGEAWAGKVSGLKGLSPSDLIRETGLGDSQEIRDILTVDGQVNFLASVPKTILRTGGRGQYVGTVSEGYAAHIRGTQFGMDKLLGSVGDHFLGILNGIDFEISNPATDKVLPYQYSLEQGIETAQELKQKNKLFLQEILGEGAPVPAIDKNHATLKKSGYLKKDPNRFLVGVVGRFVMQKQFDILADLIENMLHDPSKRIPIDFVIAGPADKNDEDGLRAMEKIIELSKNEDLRAAGINIVVLHGFVNEIGSLIYGSADAFLAPSDFEPAGIVQLISMRYGTVPIVRETGGLADTVFEGGDRRNGFLFQGNYRNHGSPEDYFLRKHNANEFYNAIARAQYVYANDKKEWALRMANGMGEENAWEHRIAKYNNLYALGTEQASLDKAAANDLQGGIDFDLNNVSMDVQSDGMERPFRFDPGLLNNGDFDGIVPVIRGVVAVTDLGSFFSSSKGQPLFSVN